MDLRHEPTVTDVAKMLDTIGTSIEGLYPETLHVLRWLIESSPQARDLYDRLHARCHDGPSLIELARLIIGVENLDPCPESVYTARWLIERSPAASELVAKLERMAADAGLEELDRDWAVRALEAHQEVDRLLASLDDWHDAGKAIELSIHRDYAYQLLLKVCRSRIARARGEKRERLERLRRRLLDAARRAAQISSPEERLEEFEASLCSLSDPRAALETAEGLLRHLRSN